MSSPFFAEVKKSSNLFAAWRHVRSSAYASSNLEIRNSAEIFENESEKQIASIQQRLAKDRFYFSKSRGVLKDKQKREKVGKRARPLVVSTLESRIVQRAVLQVLQPAVGSRLYKRLGTLKEVIHSPYNFGGTLDGGVPRAIKNVLEALDSKHVVYYKSDIGSFFTRVPHEPVSRFILEETGDIRLTELFQAALSVELDNKEELTADFDLFPSGGIGVPQGSSLSALSGNILLNEFDRNLNSLDGVRCYRYIDDVLILGVTNEAVQAAKSRAVDLLKVHKMKLYDPSIDRDKAGSGHVRSGLTYLGVAIKGSHTAPTRESRAKIISRVDERFSVAKKTMLKLLNGDLERRKRERVLAQTLTDVDLVIHGWAQSYNFVSNRLPFSQVDVEIDRRLNRFLSWHRSLSKDASPERLRRSLGIALLSDVEKRALPS